MYSFNSRGRSERSNASSCGLNGFPVTARLSSSFSIIAGRSVTALSALRLREKLQRLPYAVADGDAVGKLLHNVGGFPVAVAKRQQRVQDVRRHWRWAVDVHRRRYIGAELVLQLKQNPLRCLLADARDFRETAGFLQRDRLRKLGHRQARQHGKRDLGTDTVHLDELAKRAAFVVAAEA